MTAPQPGPEGLRATAHALMETFHAGGFTTDDIEAALRTADRAGWNRAVEHAAALVESVGISVHNDPETGTFPLPPGFLRQFVELFDQIATSLRTHLLDETPGA